MSAFRKLAEKYAALGIVPSETAKASAEEIQKELVSGFASGHDAYGNAWPALATGTASHLRETGAYEASLKVTALVGVGESRIEMSTNNAANLHAKESIQRPPGSHLEKRKHRKGAAKRVAMSGTGKPWTHPARPLLPIEGQGLPPAWEKIIGDSAGDAMRKAMK